MEEMKERGFARMERNIADVIKESQIKIGYAYSPLQLYYPLATLNHTFRTELTESEMDAYLDEFADYVSERLPGVEHSRNGQRYGIKVSADGVKYVHEKVAVSEFLVKLVEVSARHGITMDDILAVFHAFSDQVVCRKIENGEFDDLVYFADGQPDDYLYCFHQEGEHLIYHRYTRDDYADFGF